MPFHRQSSLLPPVLFDVFLCEKLWHFGVCHTQCSLLSRLTQLIQFSAFFLCMVTIRAWLWGRQLKMRLGKTGTFNETNKGCSRGTRASLGVLVCNWQLEPVKLGVGLYGGRSATPSSSRYHGIIYSLDLLLRNILKRDPYAVLLYFWYCWCTSTWSIPEQNTSVKSMWHLSCTYSVPTQYSLSPALFTRVLFVCKHHPVVLVT